MAIEDSYCLFRCQSQPFAVDVGSVAEIAEVDALVRISLCPKRIAGLCPYHRQVVPVVALGPDPAQPSSAGEQPADRGKGSKYLVLIVQSAQGLWGILIDREGTTISLERPSRHEPKDLGDGVIAAGGVIHQGNVHTLLDAECTWRGLRALVLSWYSTWQHPGTSPGRVIASTVQDTSTR
jgi:purine-binding chemotaxis protein CheW